MTSKMSYDFFGFSKVDRYFMEVQLILKTTLAVVAAVKNKTKLAESPAAALHSVHFPPLSSTSYHLIPTSRNLTSTIKRSGHGTDVRL